MKPLLLILCLLPYTLSAQHDKAIEQIFLTGFGFYAPDPISGKVVGKPVPNFRLMTPGGVVFTPDSLKGRVVVMDFWATWCEWCKRMAEDFERVLTKYPEDKVVLLGVTYKEKNKKEGLKYWEEAGYSFPMTLNSKEPGASLGAGHPSVVVIDQHGTVRGLFFGWSPAKVEEIDLLVSYLLGELEVSIEAASRSIESGDYMRAMVILDLLLDEEPEMERSLWSLRHIALRRMANPNAAKYIDYLKEKYADDQEIMAQLEAVKHSLPLTIENVNVVDVIDGRLLSGQNILIIDETIVAISPLAGKGVPGRKIDGEGAYVVSGRVDTRVHIANGKTMNVSNVDVTAFFESMKKRHALFAPPECLLFA